MQNTATITKGMEIPNFAADYSSVMPSEQRTRMLRAAMEVIAEHAFEHVTMDRIAARAGVSRLKLYREFGNRVDLVEAVAAYRLMVFDLKYFASVDHSLPLAMLVERYLVQSMSAFRDNAVSRRWAAGGMKFLSAGSLVHRTGTATWSPVVTHAQAQGWVAPAVSAEDLALWLATMQYTLGRMIVETGLEDKAALTMVRHFIVPAFSAMPVSTVSI